MATKKIGRPTDSLKSYMLRTRMDEETVKMLDSICECKQKSRSEVVRDGIALQYADISK